LAKSCCSVALTTLLQDRFYPPACDRDIESPSSEHQFVGSRVAPQSRQRRGAVHVCRRAVRLERIHSDLARSMKIVPWFRIKRRNMATRTLALAVEDFFAAFCRVLVKGAVRWLWRRDRQLVEVQRSYEPRGSTLHLHFVLLLPGEAFAG